MDLEASDLLEKIHQDALTVLEEVGVRCDSPRIRQIFEATGLAAIKRNGSQPNYMRDDHTLKNVGKAFVE